MLKKKTAKNMLEEFLGEYVAVVTKGETTIQTEDGIVHAPFMMEGSVREIDDTWIMLAGVGESSKIVKIEDIVALETVDPNVPNVKFGGHEGAIN